MRVMLVVDDLWVEAGGREILRGVSLEVEEGEIIALLGPNGSGKSSLMHAIMGNPKYRVKRGRIYFMGRDVTGLPPSERARLGMGIVMQIPPRIRGIRLGDLIREISKLHGTDLDYVLGLAEEMEAEYLLQRDLHDGFSGGEMKRAEILILAAQRPKLSLLDEPDSGVDVEALPIIGGIVKEVLRGDDPRRGGIVVTHTGRILRYLGSVSRAYIMVDGEITCIGDPEAILSDVERHGFEWCSSRAVV